MLKIFLGPGGVPISAKDRSTSGGLERVAELGLNAMELEFVRKVYLNPITAKEIGKKAADLGIRLSIHAPYFINLCSEKKEVIAASKRMIFDSASIGEIVRADAIAIHSAYYGKFNSEQASKILEEHFQEVWDKMKENGIRKIELRIETMGRKSQFGGLDEVLEFCKEVKFVQPYIDWAHLFVRNYGSINYSEVFDKLEGFKIGHINSHFEGVKKDEKGNYVDIHTPINSHPPFEPLAKEILKRKIDITIISESPLLEQDSLKMKGILEKLGHGF